jgi:NhaP-type Na+/H+ or K+/H+ antiporter
VEIELAVLALLVAVYALVAARLDRLSIGPALAFLAIGIVLADDVLGPVSITPDSEAVRVLAEASLTLLLFVDASTIRARALAHDIGPVSRLLVIGLPLTIVLGAVAALVLFPGMPLGLAVLIGATLAPTDAALSQAVISDQVVPARIRRLLNVESGLNDGIATPFVVFGIALSVAEEGGTAGLGEAVTELVVGVAVGLLIGFVGGWLLRAVDRRAWTSPVSRQLFVLALAASCYLASVAIGGNGFIAAFVGGLAFGSGTRGQEHEAVRFTEIQGSLLAIGVWISFGLTLAGHVLTEIFDPAVLVYAVLSLTAIRMVPVALSLVGSRFALPTVAFVGWFGPRGLASIVFLILGLDGLETAGVGSGPFASVVAWTVLSSVVLHGLSAGPVAAWYGRRMTTLPERSPELADDAEPAPPRIHWGGDFRFPPAI